MLAASLLWLAGPWAGAAALDAATPAFVADVFDTPPPPATLALEGPLTPKVSGLLGKAYDAPRITYWAKDGKTAWILESWGKSCLITAGFVITEGRIARSEVIGYKERRGREIKSRRFLDQFQGAALGANLELDRTIDAMTGATISSTMMVKLARLALLLDATVQHPR